MRSFSRFSSLALVGGGLLCHGLVGCTGGGGDYKPAKDLPVSKAPHAHEHAQGPHGGELIELGNEEYHAELVLDAKTHALRIYLLGPDAKTAATTAAEQVTLNVEGGSPLVLKPAADQEAGKAATFELVDEKAVHALADAGFIHGGLQVKIGDKAFSAPIDIHFDGDHDHGHGEKKPEPAPAEKPVTEAATPETKPAEPKPETPAETPKQE